MGEAVDSVRRCVEPPDRLRRVVDGALLMVPVHRVRYKGGILRRHLGVWGHVAN